MSLIHLIPGPTWRQRLIFGPNLCVGFLAQFSSASPHCVLDYWPLAQQLASNGHTPLAVSSLSLSSPWWRTSIRRSLGPPLRQAAMGDLTFGLQTSVLHPRRPGDSREQPGRNKKLQMRLMDGLLLQSNR